MGSAVLGDAIGAIRDWSVSASKETRATNAAGANGSNGGFGSLVFNDEVQQARLPKGAYHALLRTMIQGDPLDLSVADEVARAIKE